MNDTNRTPGLINWLGYLAITVLLTLPLSVLTVRSGAWQEGLLLYALSCLGATLIIIVAIVLLMLPAYAPWRGGIVKRAMAALPGTLLLFLLVGNRGDYPPIHDITTDLDNPPVFTAAEQQRGPGSNSLEIKEEAILEQGKAYPDIQTLLVDMSIEEAFDRALAVAGDMGWEIYHQDRNAGVIEAVDTTAIMAFKDDVVIRVRSNADGTLIDLRSVSRVGIGDIGANAKRIRAFQQRFRQ